MSRTVIRERESFWIFIFVGLPPEMELSGMLHAYEFPPPEPTGIGVTIVSGVDVLVTNTTGTFVGVVVGVDVSVGGMRVGVESTAYVSVLMGNVATTTVF